MSGPSSSDSERERGPLDGGNVRRRAFARALRRARLPQIRFHDLRHCYASLLIAQGEHPKLISEQLGHASVQITLDRYGQLMDQSYGDASGGLEAAPVPRAARRPPPPPTPPERNPWPPLRPTSPETV